MSREIDSSDKYLDRLYKLLPAEVTGAYIAIRTLIDPTTNTNDGHLLFFAAVIFVLAPFLYYWALNIKNALQVTFLTFSYVVWAANIDIVKIVAAKPPAWLNAEVANFVLNATFIKGVLIIWVILLVPVVWRDPSSSRTPTAQDPLAQNPPIQDPPLQAT